MKVCPKCKAHFEDDLNFCLHDGTSLSSATQAEIPTENYPAHNVGGAVTEQLPRDIDEEQTVARQAGPSDRPASHGTKRPRKIFIVLLVAIVLGIVVFVLGIGAVLYYMLNRQPELGRANSNSIVLSNVNAGSGSNVPNTNSIPPIENTNSSVPSNTLSAPNGNINAANRKVTPTPAKTVEPRVTPSLDVTPPPMPTPKSAPMTVSGGQLNGKAISLPKPVYPAAARAVGASGSVTVQVLINEEGRVISATPTSGHPLLQQAAVAAARGARFSPTLLSGQPVKVSGVITYNFVP